MISTFRHGGFEQLWKSGKQLEQKTPISRAILDVLDVIDAAGSAHDPAFIGFRFDEWIESSQPRYGMMISDHWLISYGWSDGHAIDVDLERLD